MDKMSIHNRMAALNHIRAQLSLLHVQLDWVEQALINGIDGEYQDIDVLSPATQLQEAMLTLNRLQHGAIDAHEAKEGAPMNEECIYCQEAINEPGKVACLGCLALLGSMQAQSSNLNYGIMFGSLVGASIQNLRGEAARKFAQETFDRAKAIDWRTWPPMRVEEPNAAD
jgi:hypothetical protein